MSAKLDLALDDIVKTGRKNRPGPGRRTTRRVTTKTPSGGITKKTTIKTVNSVPASKAATVKAAVAPTFGDSKVLVSNLPQDVSEAQIKEYFGKTIGFIKKVIISYGPDGLSRGIATIIFSSPESAAKAAELNGVKVDNRHMRIEVIVSAKQAPTPAPPKTLGDRIAQKPAAAAKNQPKPAAAANTKKAATNGAKGRRNVRKANPRGKPKSAAELDAEMTDYFGAGEGNGQNGVAPATNGGDVGMDEVM